jgi:hypothetical protein
MSGALELQCFCEVVARAKRVDADDAAGDQIAHHLLARESLSKQTIDFTSR